MNQSTLVVALVVLFYFGANRVPRIIKENKEILLVVGFLLYLFYGSEIEGFCLVSEAQEVQTACGDLQSIPDNCPNETCARALTSWFNGADPEKVCEHTQDFFEQCKPLSPSDADYCASLSTENPCDDDDKCTWQPGIPYTSLQTLTQKCQSLLNASPEGPTSSTPPPSPNSRSCQNIHPDAIDNTSDNWNDNGYMSFEQYMNCGCGDTTDTASLPMGTYFRGGVWTGSMQNYFGAITYNPLGYISCQSQGNSPDLLRSGRRRRDSISEGDGSGEVNRPTCEPNTPYKIFSAGHWDGTQMVDPYSHNDFPGCEKSNGTWSCSSRPGPTNNILPCKCPPQTKSRLLSGPDAPNQNLSVSCENCTEQEILDNTHNCGGSTAQISGH